jgi:hypothetical protein
MKVLVACEFSGTVRDAFTKLGHYAMSCDLLPTETPGAHYQGDIFKLLSMDYEWDLMIAHPPCTFLCVSGARWLNSPLYPNRLNDRAEAANFFMRLAEANIKKIALENPIGYMSTYWRKPDQIVKPFQYGDDASKSTCLWLKNLPKLKPTNIIEPTSHYSKSGARYDKWWFDTCLITDLEKRRAVRSKTFQGIANAMAKQWGNL